MKILSLDIGFRNTGWSIWQSGEKRPVDIGVIQTKKTKVKNILVADDRATRCAVLATGLRKIANTHDIVGVIGEMPSGGSQSAISNVSMGLAVGVVSAFVALQGFPAEWCTQQAVKKAAVGKFSATKEEIMKAIAGKMAWQISEKHGEMRKKDKKTKKVKIIKTCRTTYHTHLGNFPATNFEHVADSIAAFWALENGILVRMINKGV